MDLYKGTDASVHDPQPMEQWLTKKTIDNRFMLIALAYTGGRRERRNSVHS